MGLFSAPKSSFPWTNLESSEQLHILITASETKPVLFFKHSTRCSISRFALSNFEREFPVDQEVELVFLDLIEHRDLSNEMAHTLNVVHESPQAILVMNGKVVHHSSHENIDAETISASIKPY